MTRTRTCRIIALWGLPLLVAAAPALAQSENDVRRENQRLRTQVNDQRRELEAARHRIQQLETEVEWLRRQLAASTTSPDEAAPPSGEQRVTIDETVPNASPRALLTAVQANYAEAMKDVEIGDPGTAEGYKQRTVYLRDLGRWARRLNREMKSPIVWHVRIERFSGQAAGTGRLELQAVDPETLVNLGDPFTVRLSRPILRRLRQLDQRQDLDVLVLRGVLMPRLAVNPDRANEGLFDNPRFIGPFAEFGMLVEPSTLTPSVEPQESAELR